MIKQSYHTASTGQVIAGQQITRFWLSRVKSQQPSTNQTVQDSQRTDLVGWDRDWDHGPWDRGWDNAHEPWDRGWDNSWDKSDYGDDPWEDNWDNTWDQEG